MTPTFRRVLLLVPAIACYLTAFFLPTLYLTGQANTAGQHTYMIGLAACFDGFWALFDRQYAWLANPLAALGLILLLRRAHTLSLVLSLAALAIAQHTWAVDGSTIWGDEGGVTKYLVTSLGPGFYLWSFSFLLLALAALIGRFQERQNGD